MADAPHKPRTKDMPAFSSLLMASNPLVSEATAREIVELARVFQADLARQAREAVYDKIPAMPSEAWPEAAATRH